MSYVKICNTSTVHHFHTSMLFIGCIAHCILSLKPNLIIVIKRKEHTLRRPYQTRARVGAIGETEEVQERIKGDMEAMKEKMATMMEAMMRIKKIMEVNVVAAAIASAVDGVDLTPPSGLNQINHPASDVGGPHFVQIHNKHAFSTYGLSPNFTPAMHGNMNHATPATFNGKPPRCAHKGPQERAH